MKQCMYRLLLITTVFLLWACASSKGVTSDSKIVFGNYGGFAGSYTEFTVWGDGDVHYRNAPKGEVTVIRPIDARGVRQLFESIENQALYNLGIYDPGNLSYFLKFEYRNRSYHLLWGGNEGVPLALKNYYKLLSQLTKDRNPVM